MFLIRNFCKVLRKQPRISLYKRQKNTKFKCVYFVEQKKRKSKSWWRHQLRFRPETAKKMKWNHSNSVSIHSCILVCVCVCMYDVFQQQSKPEKKILSKSNNNNNKLKEKCMERNLISPNNNSSSYWQCESTTTKMHSHTEFQFSSFTRHYFFCIVRYKMMLEV